MPLPAMNDWMDDLSEDWVSQPRSESVPSSPSQLRSSRRRSILSEQSQNESNIQGSSVQRGGKGLSRRSLSDASTGSQGRYDTTARKSVSVSPPKSRREDGEPEWRRRLLQGQIGLGEQKDLFSPMAIENIFQKPAPLGSMKKAQHDKPRGLSFLKSFDNIPSSPPPWPQTTTQRPQPSSRFGTVNSRYLPALDEEDEASKFSSGIESHTKQADQSMTSNAALSEPPNPHIVPTGSVIHDERPSRRVSFNSVRLQPASRKASDTNSWNATQNSDDFSPVFISKHNTADGRIAYAALDLTKAELEKLKRLRAAQSSRDSNLSQSSRAPPTFGDESSLARIESENLPEDLPVGTPDIADVASIGEFVSIKRGGYSDIGSFKRRPLSPSPLGRPLSTSVDDSSMFETKATLLHHSEIPPAVPTPPPAAAPRTPHTEKRQDFLSPQRTKSSNSPLKLFENHDTFTANRLQRRISQLEEPDADDLAGKKLSPSRRTTAERLSMLEEQSFVENGDVGTTRIKEPMLRQSSIQQRFGHGDFDDYTFTDDRFSSPRSSEAERDLPSRSPSPDMMPPGYQQPFRFHVDSPPPDFVDTFKGKRKPSKASANGGLSISKRSDRTRPKLNVTIDTRVTSQPSQVSVVSEGKRPLTPSPFKSPTPKRRRTIIHHEEELEEREVQTVLTHQSHESFQSALSRKRKDARHGTERNLADADILAQRSILRPRNPTPSQRRRQEAEQAVRDAQVKESVQPQLESIQEQLSVPPQPGESAESVQVRAIATHLAVISEDVQQRKKSVTTQDFLDDAMKVMQFIRTQYRPNSNLASVNEQESAMLNEPSESALDFSGLINGLTLERPPSRDGRPSGWRTSRAEQTDPRVVSHLRRFQEEDGDSFFTASSRATTGFQTEAAAVYIETIMSDPPGLQIIGQSAATQQRSRSRSDSNPSDNAVDSNGTNDTKGSKATHSSRTSIDSTLGRTTNSRKSENVATLAPDAVAHLIPEHIAGMTFDKELGRWVKAKGPRKERPISNEHSGMTASDNDPFGDIPDLTVDSIEETKHLLLSRSAGRHPIGHPPEGASALLSEFESRPSTRDEADATPAGLNHSPEPSRVHLSPPKPQGPRAQKMSSPVANQRQNASPKTSDLSHPTPRKTEAPGRPEEEDVEHEFSILEGRSEDMPPSEVRNITVSLSSPKWSRGKAGLSPVLESPGVSTRDYGYKAPRTTPLFHRQNDRQLSLSVRVNGTVSTRRERHAVAEMQSSPYRGDVTFCLSELPEFTLNQMDERESQSRLLSVLNTVGPVFKGIEDRYASGNHLLVKALQDNEPDEPYWEDLRKVDVHGKGLTSLHLLDVLCDRVETLDASRNALSQLNGAPHTVRCLSVHNNMLTSLTAWSHLFNLQYLDISHNQVDSLQGLAGLVHLRELRADANQISNLNGIENLDGLLRLSLRSNELVDVDFEGCELRRLETLDLGANKLINVSGLHALPVLRDLQLDSNSLQKFPQEDKLCVHLQSLNLSRNDVSELNLASFCPRLNVLNMDGNRLASTASISELKHLQKLLMRSQRPSIGNCDLSPILEARMRDLTTLCLSENHISGLALPHDWYSLGTLEIASCGLQELPADFGLSVPNLRSLNLNFNAIKDLRPILNVKSLSELHVAGNRLARLRKTTAVLSKLRALEVLDLRDNPFSIGFHPKAVEQRLVSIASSLPESDGEFSTSPRDDRDSEQNMQFLLPPCDPSKDAEYFARLDDGTKLRRRVYEMLLANNCKTLAELDGLHFRREAVLVRDEIWDRLVMLGVLKKSGRIVEEESEKSD